MTWEQRYSVFDIMECFEQLVDDPENNIELDPEEVAVYNQLVANAVMLQNVVDQTRVLHELHQEGYPISKDDLAFMSPYVTRNLNRFGDYPTWYKTESVPAAKELPI